MRVQFVKKSSNAKIGKIPCTTTERRSCPDACPMKGDTACYAEGGYYTRMNWDKVDSGERGGEWGAFLQSVRKLPEGQLWRHNVAGDLVGEDNTIDRDALEALTRANAGRNGFTYTHYPVVTGGRMVQRKNNVSALLAANRDGFTVNASANNPTQAAVIRGKYGLPTVTLVENEEWWQGASTRDVGGHKVARCLAEYNDATSCDTCRLCAASERQVIVGFTAHGAGKKKTEMIARG